MLLSLKWIMISMKTLKDCGMQDENDKIAENKLQTSAEAATTGPARHSAAQQLSLSLKSLISSNDDECRDTKFLRSPAGTSRKTGRSGLTVKPPDLQGVTASLVLCPVRSLQSQENRMPRGVRSLPQAIQSTRTTTKTISRHSSQDSDSSHESTSNQKRANQFAEGLRFQSRFSSS